MKGSALAYGFIIMIIGLGIAAGVYAYGRQTLMIELIDVVNDYGISGDTFDFLNTAFRFIPVSIVLAALLGFIGLGVSGK